VAPMCWWVLTTWCTQLPERFWLDCRLAYKRLFY
jgi:hypothetical protein